jgi:hypothetical protein
VEVLSSSSEHACVPANFLSHMAFAPSSPSVPPEVEPARVRHFGIEARYFAMHFFLPTLHFDCVVGGGSMAVLQLSAAVSAASVSPVVMQSAPFLLSSFAKQPLDEVRAQ